MEGVETGSSRLRLGGGAHGAVVHRLRDLCGDDLHGRVLRARAETPTCDCVVMGRVWWLGKWSMG